MYKNSYKAQCNWNAILPHWSIKITTQRVMWKNIDFRVIIIDEINTRMFTGRQSRIFINLNNWAKRAVNFYQPSTLSRRIGFNWSKRLNVNDESFTQTWSAGVRSFQCFDWLFISLNQMTFIYRTHQDIWSKIFQRCLKNILFENCEREKICR